MNMHIPEEYGGVGLGGVEACIAGGPLVSTSPPAQRPLRSSTFPTALPQAENLAYGCSGISTAIGGPALAESPLIVGASHEQKKKYLGRMTEEPLLAA